MNIPTPDSLRATRRPLARRVGRSKRPSSCLPRCAPARHFTCNTRDKARAGRCRTAGRSPTALPNSSLQARQSLASATLCSTVAQRKPIERHLIQQRRSHACIRQPNY